MKNVMLDQIESQSQSYAERASYGGVAVKSLFYIIITMGFAIFTMIQIPQVTDYAAFGSVLMFALIIGFISGMVAIRSVRFAKIAGLFYTAAQGIVIGWMVTLVESFVPNAGTIALAITGAIFFVMLALYSSGIVRNTPMVRKFTMILAVTSLLLVFASLFISIFTNFFATEAGLDLLLIMSVVILLFGIFALISDFDRIDQLVQGGFDKRFEWTAAIGLVMTLILIYVEILRLILILSQRNSR